MVALLEPTFMMPSCFWRRPWTPLWSNDRSPPRMNPNTCAWTKAPQPYDNLLQAVGLPPDTAIRRTSDASVRRSWTPSGEKRHPARRWVVERTLAWLSKCRAVLVRYDKKASNYLGVRRPLSQAFGMDLARVDWLRSCGSVGSGVLAILRLVPTRLVAISIVPSPHIISL